MLPLAKQVLKMHYLVRCHHSDWRTKQHWVMLSTYLSLYWLPHVLQVLHIIENKRHEWWPLLGMQPCCSVGTDGYRGRACAAYRINGCAWCTFTDKEGIYDYREMNWPSGGGLFLKSQCNKLVPKKKPLVFPMKSTTRESQQSQSLLMGARVNAPINTHTKIWGGHKAIIHRLTAVATITY